MKPYALRVSLCVAMVFVASINGSVPQDRKSITVVQGLDAYARGEFDQVSAAIVRIAGLTGFARELQRQAPAWIEAAGENQVPRRRLIVATVALQTSLAMPPRLVDAPIAVDLITWSCGVVRKNPARSEGEHRWHLAALAALQRIMLPGLLREYRDPIAQVLLAHVNHGHARYPDDPAWQLGTAVSVELNIWHSTPGVETAFRRDRADRAIRAYQKLLSDRNLAPDAHLRTAYLKFRLGAAENALKHLDQVQSSGGDRMLLYLAAFIRGQIHQTTGSFDKAAEAYEDALASWPGAQSAATALAAIRFREHRRADARALAQAALRKPAREDPWRHYGRGDYRLEELLQRLREVLSLP